MSNNKHSTLFWGVPLVVAGLVILLINLDVIPANRAEWWPVLVIAEGLWLLANGLVRRASSTVSGLVLSSLGTYWLLDHLSPLPESLFLPVLFISLGAGLVLRRLLRLPG